MNLEGNEYIAGEYDVAVIGAGHAGCEAGTCICKTRKKDINIFNKFRGNS